MDLKQICSSPLSDRGRWCASSVASPSLSSATPWIQSLCHCPNCPDRLPLSHFRVRARGREMNKSHCIIFRALVHSTATKTNVYLKRFLLELSWNPCNGFSAEPCVAEYLAAIAEVVSTVLVQSGEHFI